MSAPLVHEESTSFLILKSSNAKTGIETHATFTFLGRSFSRVQLFAAEVTLRKHSCFSRIWCHHRTTPPVLIFNKDKTFIGQLQTVRAWSAWRGDKQHRLLSDVTFCSAWSSGTWQMKKAFSLINEKWVAVVIKSNAYYWFVQLDTPVMCDPRASLTTPPWGHIKADATQALTLEALSESKIHRDLSIFSAQVLEGRVSLSTFSYLLK